MPCFVTTQDTEERKKEKNLRQINMCEIEGMIVPKHFTKRNSRDTNGDLRRGEREREGFFQQRGIQGQRRREL